MEEWEAREEEKAKKVVRELSSFVNSMSRRPKFFVNEVMQEHRTLQQSMFGLFLACIEKWASLESGWYDGRNEATVMASKKIVAALDGVTPLS